MSTDATIAITLSEVERQRLNHKERVIERGAQQIGEALRDIRDERLYRETHGTFEAYCEQRWGMSPRHANRQIAAVEVAEAIGPIGPIPESQARELAPLRDNPDRMREVWDAANEATDGKPTAAAIRAARTSEPDYVTDEADLAINRETGEITDIPKPRPAKTTSPSADLSLINDVRLYLRALAKSTQVASLSPTARGHLIDALQTTIDSLKGMQP